MTYIYHGGQKIENKIKSPLFFYEDISTSIYFAINYSGLDNNLHISKYQINKNAKVFDLTSDDENITNIFNNLLKISGFSIDLNSNLIKNSYQDVGRDVYFKDVDMALYPKFREELLKSGFNVLKTHSTFENINVISYAVLDSKSLTLNTQYKLDYNNDNDNIQLEVIYHSTNSKIGNLYKGELGYGDISLKSIVKKKYKIH